MFTKHTMIENYAIYCINKLAYISKLIINFILKKFNNCVEMNLMQCDLVYNHIHTLNFNVILKAAKNRISRIIYIFYTLKKMNCISFTDCIYIYFRSMNRM